MNNSSALNHHLNQPVEPWLIANWTRGGQTACAKLYSSKSPNNSILAGVQYIYKKICLNIGHLVINIG